MNDETCVVIRQPDYVLPRPWASDEDYRRFYHLDLAEMPLPRRWAEHERARMALAALLSSDKDPLIRAVDGWPLAASAWLRERIERTRGARP